jgi:hypothetical protein
MRKKTSRMILLTGAGSSTLVGLKTLKSIVDGIQGVHVPLDNQDPAIELVKETWKVIKGQEGDKATLELLLAKLKLYSQVADIIKSDHVFSDELRVNLPHVVSGQFKLKWENALAYCFRLMIDNYGPHRVQVDCKGFEVLRDMLLLLAQANENTIHLFTTNYDCVVNVLAAKIDNINFFTHINNTTGAFESEWFVVNEDIQKKSNPNVYVHRLHGCVAWFSAMQSPYGVHEVFGSGTSLVIDDQNKLNQMAIKLVADEKIGNIPAFSLAFQEFSRELERCEILLVWGHSFRDLELLRCMISVAANRKKHPYRIKCIDPYLSKGKAIENIRSTIAGVPAVSSSMLNPEIIEWVTQDGFESLLSTVKKLLGL